MKKIEPLELKSYHVHRTQGGFGGDGSYSSGSDKAPDNAWGMVEAKINEMLDAVNLLIEAHPKIEKPVETIEQDPNMVVRNFPFYGPRNGK